MGTDIHAVVEVRSPEGDWTYVGQGPIEHTSEWGGETHHWPYLTARNYDLFAILADVRNGHGFAGVLTGTPVQPIAAPRGLPADFINTAPNPWRDGDPEESEFLWMGEHDFSWLTLRELEAYPWDEPRGKCGFIPAREYETWLRDSKDRTEPPERYNGGISGPGIVCLEEAAFLRHRLERTLPAGDLWVRVTWTERHRDACPGFCDVVLPWLRELRDANHLDGDDVRIVFGFDS